MENIDSKSISQSYKNNSVNLDNISNNPKNTIEDLKAGIEILRKNIEDERVNNVRYTSILANFNKNSQMTDLKNRGNIFINYIKP